MLAASITLGLVALFFWIAKSFDQAVLTRAGTCFRLAECGPAIALTFDDGPDPLWTPAILRVLRRFGVQATFFLVGRQVRRHPEVVRAILADGHQIGHHTYAHGALWTWSKARLLADLRACEDALRKACAKETSLLRPPKGLIRPGQKSWLSQRGWQVVMWTRNAKDWATRDPRRIVRRLGETVETGDIVLFHDGGGVFSFSRGDRSATVAALEFLIPEWKRRGWRFVPLIPREPLDPSAAPELAQAYP